MLYIKVTDEMVEAQRAQNTGPGSQLAHGSQVLNPLGLSTLPQTIPQTKLFRDTLNRAHQLGTHFSSDLERNPRLKYPFPSQEPPPPTITPGPCPAPPLAATLEQKKNPGSPQERCCYLGLQRA